MMYEKERKELADICHLLYGRGLVAATDGNVSFRVTKGHILLTPSGKNKGFVGPEEMLVVDLDGNVVEGSEGQQGISHAPAGLPAKGGR